MKTSFRNFLIILLLFASLGIGLLGYGAYRFLSFFDNIGKISEEQVPAVLKKTGVKKSKLSLQKTEIFKKESESFVDLVRDAQTQVERKKHFGVGLAIYGFNDLKVCGDELIAVGQFGGFALTKAGKLKRRIYLEPDTEKIKVLFINRKMYSVNADNITIIDLENDGKCEFVANSSGDGITTYDSKGDITWRLGKRDRAAEKELDNEEEAWITGVHVEDIDGDGLAEFIVSKKEDGVRMLSSKKKEIWYSPGKFPVAKFRVADIDGDGKKDLLEFQGAGSTIRDKLTGKVLKEVKLDGSVDGVIEPFFDIGKPQKSAQFFHFEKNKLVVFNASGEELIRADAPLSEVHLKPNEKKSPPPTPKEVSEKLIVLPTLSREFPESVYEPRALWVKLAPDAPPYFAVVGSFIGIPRANFYLYDTKGNLVFHELLPEDAETITKSRRSNGTDEIFVGGKNTIWKYRVK